MMKGSGIDGRSIATEVDAVAAAEIEWEMRPGGMLVQKRLVDPCAPPPPAVRLRIYFGGSKLEVSVGSRDTFWDLKKVLEAHIKLRPAEQRVMYKGKERDNGEYLDQCRVKDRSKLVVMEDPSSCERRFIEMRRNAKIQSTAVAVAALSLEVDKLADQVTAIEKSIAGGNKVPELQITTLIELLMRQAVKLDGMSAEGGASSQKTLQAKRVQKCVESLDVLKKMNGNLKPVIVTTKWETFDPPSAKEWEFFD